VATAGEDRDFGVAENLAIGWLESEVASDPFFVETAEGGGVFAGF
jgi:hypothetical protein